MHSILDDLFLPYLKDTGFLPVSNDSLKRRCGVSLQLDPDVGEGYCWVYPVRDLFLVTSFSATFQTDLSVRCTHGCFASVSSCETSSARHFYGLDFRFPESLVGYVCNDGEFLMKAGKGDSIRSVGISFTPRFFHKYLDKRFTMSFSQMGQTVSKLNGTEVIPEISLLLRQIRTFSPSRDIAGMYYEAKLLELLALLGQWDEKQRRSDNLKHVDDLDLEHVRNVAAYIRENFACRISLDTLSNMACMCHNKLSAIFKLVHGVTITEFIQSLRIEKAKVLLADTDLKIGRVAREVGYKHQGSFSGMFRKETGLNPYQFRKKLMR